MKPELKQALERFAPLDRALRELEEDQAEVLALHASLVAVHKEALGAIKTAMGDLPSGTLICAEGVECRKTIRHTVDPVALARVSGAKRISGLFVQAVDTKVLAGAVKAGVLDEEAVNACRTVVVGETVKARVLDLAN